MNGLPVGCAGSAWVCAASCDATRGRALETTEATRCEAFDAIGRRLAKLDDLRHHYAIRVVVEWAQALELYLPVQRFDVLIRRRKGERSIRLDWHPLVRTAEPAPCDWGLGMERTRLVCDDKLHLTNPAGQAPCLSCAKAWCRACHPARCPRCGSATKRGASQGGRAQATEQKII